MKITKAYRREGTDSGTMTIALFDSNEILIADDASICLLSTTGDLIKHWWKEEVKSDHLELVKQYQGSFLEASRPMALWGWDIGHRFLHDPRRAEALKLLLTEII